MNIGKNIRKKRIELNMSQDELAEKMYVTRQTISNYETGKRNASVETLQELAKVFNCELEELIYGSKSINNQHLKKYYTWVGIIVLSCLLIQIIRKWESDFVLVPVLNRISIYYLYPFLFGFLGYVIMQILQMSGLKISNKIKSNNGIYKVILMIAILYFLGFFPHFMSIILYNLTKIEWFYNIAFQTNVFPLFIMNYVYDEKYLFFTAFIFGIVLSLISLNKENKIINDKR